MCSVSSPCNRLRRCPRTQPISYGLIAKSSSAIGSLAIIVCGLNPSKVLTLTCTSLVASVTSVTPPSVANNITNTTNTATIRSILGTTVRLKTDGSEPYRTVGW